MNRINITDIEAAINWWRERAPSSDGISNSPEVGVLAHSYAGMALAKASDIAVDSLSPEALDAWLAWYDSTPDSPCIAICSTAQGDPVCKGCGRSFDEVQQWPALSPMQKRVVWHRITSEGTAWRFNRYAERAAR